MQDVKDLLSNKRFVAIIGMLGSSGSGEAANAAAMATKMLKDAGLTWAELLNGMGGGGPDPYHSSTLQRLFAAQRAQEAAETRARKAEAKVRDVTEQLRIANLANEGLKARLKDFEKPDPEKFKGFTFSHADDAPFRPLSYIEIEPFLKVLVGRWDDLNDWEEGFFRDFVENQRGVKTEKQWAVFKRVSDKFKIPIDT